jgi:hypothetical protein
MDRFRNNNKHSTALTYGLLMVLLTLWVGGAVSHYCFDGLEPPVTVHFDNLSRHVEHDSASGHLDFEKNVSSDNLLTKIFQIDIQQALVLFFVLLIQACKVSFVSYREQQLSYRSPQVILPPQRAPPTFS